MSSLVAALGVVFLAELGDKTQLVALGFGARYRLGPVLVGVAAAYMASTLLSVVIGGVLGAALPTDAISIGGGMLFIGFALWTLRSVMGASAESAPGEAAPADDRSDPGSVAEPSVSSVGVIGSVAVAMFVAELGDKTMLATATLAAQGNPVLVWLGATVGILLAGTVGVVVGRLLGSRLPERAILIGSSMLFAIFGVVLIASGVTG
jgi:Ca2+/H+ antiporter, TMEM165/GDT1 family